MALNELELEKARKYAQEKFNELREGEFKWSACHASHTAAEALRLAEEQFSLDTFGVEGFCAPAGQEGFSYLNTGETYDLTLGAYTEYHDARFVLTSWGDVAEHNPDWR